MAKDQVMLEYSNHLSGVRMVTSHDSEEVICSQP